MKLNGIWVGVSLLVTLGATAACGGDDNEGGGKAGSGNAGSATQAGSGGSSSGGSASLGGNATGVSGSVGTAGSSAGSGTAGTSTGGSASGGDCAAVCAKPTVKACRGESCVESCKQAEQQFLAFFPECSAQWNAQFACIVKQPNENVMCEGSIITSPACANENAALEACGN
jgi:hypothetical protein